LSILAAVFNVATCIPILAAQYLAIGAFAILRPAVYAATVDFVGKTFGFKDFGKLQGLMTLTSGVFNLNQYLLNWIALSVCAGDFEAINIAFSVCCCVVGGILALVLWRREQAYLASGASL
jgi:hypothetical protein